MAKIHTGWGWTAAVALALTVSACQQAKNEAPEGVAWLTSMDAALADAQKQGRPILLNFYTDW